MVVNLSLEMLCFVLAGILLVRLNILEKGFAKKLSTFIMDVALPCMLVRIITQEEFEGDLAELAVIIGMAFAYLAVLFILGQVFYKAMGQTENARLARFSCIFTNFTFFGVPIMEGLYGARGLFLFTMFCLPARFFYYGSPAMLLTGASEHKGLTFRQKARHYITPPIIAIFIGLFLYFTGIELPSFLSNAVKGMGGVCSPLGMMICGMTIADVRLKDVITNRPAIIMTLAKGLAAPLCIIALVCFIPLDPLLKKVICMDAALPIPALITTFSLQYNLSEPSCRNASLALCASTVLAIISTPLWAMAFDVIFK